MGNGLRNKIKKNDTDFQMVGHLKKEVIRANENMMMNFDNISILKYSYFSSFFAPSIRLLYKWPAL